MISVEEYYKMADSGLIAPDSRVELLDGVIVEMAAMGSPHASCVSKLYVVFARTLLERATLRAQLPVRLNEFSEPEPDFALVRFRADHYGTAHPVPADVFVLVEVGDATAKIDRKRKLPLYRQAGIPEIWLIDLTAKVIEVHIGETVRTVRAGDTLSPQAFPDLAIDVAHLLA